MAAPFPFSIPHGSASLEPVFRLELSHLTLVDQDVLSFRRHSEADGIELKNCAAYVPEWVKQETS